MITGEIEKKAFFFGPEDQAMYGMAHLPASPAETAVIFCQAFADEVQRSYRPFYNFANVLAQNGYLAFRFDYRGCGDSRMRHLDTDVSTRLEDINSAIKYVKEKYQAKKTVLLGLRFGASLAVLSAAKNGDTDALLLWEPIIDGNKYFYDCLRLNIATQTIIYRKVKYNRNQLVERLAEGNPVYIDGYGISKRLFDQGCDIKISDKFNEINIPALIVNISPRLDTAVKWHGPDNEEQKSNDGNALLIRASIKGFPFWYDKRNYIPRHDDLFKISLDWIKGRF